MQSSRPADDASHLKFPLEEPGLLFTVLVWCLLTALDLTGDTKDHRGPLLDYEVKGYFTVVLFDNGLCRSATPDGSSMSD